MKDLILKITSNKWNYYLSLVSDFLTAMVFLGLSIHYSTDLWSSISLFVVGAIFFTFLEYAVHAWLFHKDHPLKVFIEGHAHHHQNPFSGDAFAIVGGLTLGYFNYGIMHHIMHRREFLSNYWKYMQEFHFVHHKKPLLNHGVTTDIWDRVFGTYYQWNEEDLKGMEKLKRIKKK